MTPDLAPRAVDVHECATLHCSFCGIERSHTFHMIFGAARRVAICADCVEVAADIIREKQAKGRPHHLRVTQ